MVEYAAFLLNRFEVGHDGKTTYERLKGTRMARQGIEFGEAVHCKSGGGLGKFVEQSAPWGAPRGEG